MSPLNYLTFDPQPRGKKYLLQSDWTDARSVCINRTRVYFKRRDAQNERQERSSVKYVHKINAHYALYVTLVPASYCDLGLNVTGT